MPRRTLTPLLALVPILIFGGPWASIPTAAQEAPDRVLVQSWDRGPAGGLAVDRGAVGLWQKLQKLTTTGSVLYTTGHPDDEEAGVLTLLGRGLGARTALLTLNRGEGGANAVGPELFDALGLVRTEELRLAGRYYGLDDQYFTTAVDYGYSKTLDEAMRSWDRERLLADMVRVIRINRPLVVISRWHGSERDGHGHHQAAGVLTPEAVEAAADPARFPEQISREGLRPWRVRRAYRGRITEAEIHDLELDPHVRSPWLGTSYQDFGYDGLSLQRSQTSGRRRVLRGPAAPVRYQRIAPESRQAPPDDRSDPSVEAGRDDRVVTDPFHGLDTSLSGLGALTGEALSERAVAALADAQRHVAAAVDGFDLRRPEAAVAPLTAALRSLHDARARLGDAPEADFLLTVKERQAADALAEAVGLVVAAEATPAGAPPGTPMEAAVPGQHLVVHVALEAAVEGLTLRALELRGPEEWERPAGDPGPGGATDPARTVASPEPADPSGAAGVDPTDDVEGEVDPDAPVTRRLALTVPADARPTRPWFHRDDIRQNHYQVRDSSVMPLGSAPPPVTLRASLEAGDAPFDVSVPVRVVRSLAPYGVSRPPLEIVPAVSVSVDPRVVVLRPGERAVDVGVDVASNAPEGATATVSLEVPEGWTTTPRRVERTLDGAADAETVRFRIAPANGARSVTPAGREERVAATDGAGVVAPANGAGAVAPVGGGPERVGAEPVELRAVAMVDGRVHREGSRLVAHRDLRPRRLYEDATVVVQPVDVAVTRPLRVGYVMGVGDEVPAAIRQLGADVELVDAATLSGGDLSAYETIVIGTRAYAVRPDLVAANGRLLEWTRAGGNLVVLYQTPEYTPETQAPLPATLPGNAEEVSEEDAPVRLLAPNHDAMTRPNRLGPEDFEGWIEQRGSKFFATWDPGYTPLVETHDTGQAPQRGIWLTAAIGRGRFMYVALALHRQLPYGVPGAYRILANLISPGG